jgi:hypothetical protein
MRNVVLSLFIYSTQTRLSVLAFEVEAELRRHYPEAEAFKSRCRNIIYNMKSNPKLGRDLINGDIDAER